jgi:hypothetical protein
MKRGWVRILEATIAAMLAVGVVLSVYGGSVSDDVSIEESVGLLKTEILSDLVSNPELRLAILRVGGDNVSDVDFVVVNDYVARSVGGGFDYSLRICKLGGDDYCKMREDVYVATLDEDVYVGEIVVSAEVGSGSGKEVYGPKKVKIYFWER